MKRSGIRRGAYDTFSRLIGVLFSVMLAAVLLLCVFGQYGDYARRIDFLPAVLLLAVGAVFACGWAYLCHAAPVPERRGRRALLFGALSLALFAAQLLCVSRYWFKTDWDAGILMDTAQFVAHGKQHTEFMDSYFSSYPNNRFLTGVIALILRAGHLLGLHEKEYALLLGTQCLLNSLTGFFLALCADRLLRKPALTLYAYGVYVCLVGCSPWVIIPYSESYGLLFPTLILWFYLEGGEWKRPWLRWAPVALLAMVGYQIKPQILILPMALVLTRLLGLLRGVKKETIAVYAKGTAAFLLAAVAALAAVRGFNAAVGLKVDPEQRIGIAHYLMLGLNAERGGVYDADDFTFSSSFKTTAERDAADWQEARTRLRGMGASGFLQLMAKKALTNFNDGTFCWGGEGRFYREVPPAHEGRLTEVLRGLYYMRDRAGAYNAVWKNAEQAVWLTVLVLCCAAGFAAAEDGLLAAMLAIGGLAVFEQIFEARARYLFIYAPLFILVSAAGLYSLYRKIRLYKGKTCGHTG